MEGFHLVVIYLSDGDIDELITYSGIQKKGVDCGDLIHHDRGEGNGSEPTIIVGYGYTEDDARKSGHEYLREVARLHGIKNCSQIVLFGHDVSQSQFVQEMLSQEED